MRYVIFDTMGEAQQMQAITSKLHGYPARGKDRRGKPKGSASPGHGWTMRQYDILQHPTESLWAHPEVDPNTEGLISRVSLSQLQMLRDWSAAAVDLDENWSPVAS